MRITPENYEAVKTDMEAFLLDQISHYAHAAGSRENLSLALGYAENYIRRTIGRGSFSALEQIWRECMEEIKN